MFALLGRHAMRGDACRNIEDAEVLVNRVAGGAAATRDATNATTGNRGRSRHREGPLANRLADTGTPSPRWSGGQLAGQLDREIAEIAVQSWAGARAFGDVEAATALELMLSLEQVDCIANAI